MKIFVKLEPTGSGILGLATESVAGVFDVEAELPEPFDPSLLDGYELKFNVDKGCNEAIFSVLRWRKAKTQKEEEERQQASNNAYSDVLHEAVLAMATDEQAISMMDMYPKWESGKTFIKDARLTYNGVLYKVVQDHTSQENWEPDKVPALFVRLSEPENEWPEFVHPTGAHDVYMAGDKVAYKDEHYICVQDNTVHAPDELETAWEKVEE